MKFAWSSRPASARFFPDAKMRTCPPGSSTSAGKRQRFRFDRWDASSLDIAREALVDHWQSGQWTWTYTLASPIGSSSEWRNSVREEATQLLSEMGPAGKPAAPELAACLEFPGHTVRVLAAEALLRVTGEARLDVLIEALEESVPDLSMDPTWLHDWTREALRVLGDMGPAARGAIPSLERLRAAARPGPLRAAAEEAIRKVARVRA